MRSPSSPPSADAADIIVLYRLVAHDPPSERDVMSYAALGKPPRSDDPEVLRLHDGISTFDSLDATRRRARRDGFVATLTIMPEDRHHLTVEQTLGPGHFTIWGSPRAILATVTGVQPIRRPTTI